MDNSALVMCPEAEVALHRAISPIIILDTCDEAAIREAIREGMEIEAITRGIVKGEYSFWEALELLEQFEHPIEEWMIEIEENLENGLIRELY